MSDQSYKSVKININGGCESPAPYKIKGQIVLDPKGCSDSTKKTNAKLCLEINIIDTSTKKLDMLQDIFNKQLGKDDKLFTMPDLYKYLLNENQFKIKLNRYEESLNVEIEARDRLQAYIQEFTAGMGLIDIKNMLGEVKHDVSFHIGFGSTLDNAKRSYCEDIFSRPLSSHLMEDSELVLFLAENNSVNAALDEAMMFQFSGYNFPYMSFMESGELEISIDYTAEAEKLGLWNCSNSKNDFFYALQSTLDNIIDYLQSLKEEEVKNLIGLAKLCQELELSEPIKLKLEIENFIFIEIKFDISEFTTFVTFLAHHPRTHEKQRVQMYKDFLTSRDLLN